ncbi:MAG: RHS repeat-associated core domain-containing protein [Anaerosomatales bacterium]|nr:RHS repeat-associated core domain-containing protein [Anaerosomatales bacterium]
MSASYAYDAYGQRVRSVVASGSLVATTAYAYDGLSLLRATTARSDGTTESVTYLYDAAGAPFAGIYEGSAAASPVAFFIATTARGDAAELLDASGAPFALYSYDAYGNPGAVLTDATARIPAALAQAIAEANALRYAGYAYDAHSGLYYLSKRYYDPATAQFLTKDPAKADGEESPYQYCGGDPVGKVDPSGEVSVAYGGGRRIRLPRRLLFGAWGYYPLGLKHYGRTIWVLKTAGSASQLCEDNPYLLPARKQVVCVYLAIAGIASIGGIDIAASAGTIGLPNGQAGSGALSSATSRAKALGAQAKRWERAVGHLCLGRHKWNRVHLWR